MGLDFTQEILRLKRERNAVILAHYYQDSQLQDLADVLGDSLALAQAAKKTTADVVVFCGVHFMAETAKILNPDRTVVIPDLDAGCSLAASCPAPLLRAWKEEHPDFAVVSYINCTAEVKALSDIICTSSNAEKVVRSIPKDRPILFCPDRNLGQWLIRKTGRAMELWKGACHVHEAFSTERIIALKLEHPDALFICHPECEEPVRFHADSIGSTTSLLNFAIESKAKKFIVGTEPGIIHQMRKKAPDKIFIPAPGQDESCNCSECPYMKLNTLEKTYLALRDLTPRIELDEALRQKALVPLERMLACA
ncbi:MAG: quinolinate synthase NadA [Deltaproteobacteria bacterium]|nr:quinolinate synthase NadA [Deltaproteobacteria bacterium]